MTNKTHSSKTFTTLATWNAQSVHKVTRELEVFLNEQDVDILLLQETFLKPSTNFSIPNYITYRNDRPPPRRGGGVAILIKRCIPHTQLPSKSYKNLETVAIELPTPKGNIVITSAYRPPIVQFDASDMQDDFNSLLSVPHQLIAGDLNAKSTDWGCFSSNPAGCTLENVLLSNNAYEILPPAGPTHTATNGHKDILDVLICDKTLSTSIPTPLDTLDSDHTPVLFYILNTPTHPAPTPRPTTSTDWKIFKQHLIKRTIKTLALRNTDDIDEAISHLELQITNALRKARRIIPPPPTKNDILPPAITKIRLLKLRARRLWQKTRNPTVKKIYKSLSNKLRYKLNELRDQQWTDRLIDAESDNTMTKIFKIARHIRTPKPHPTSLQAPDGTKTYNPKTKSKIFADMLQERFTNTPPQNYEDLSNFLSLKPYTSPPDAYDISLDELCDTIRLTSPRTSPGIDRITYEALKNLPKKTLLSITDIFNSCIACGYFPDNWKLAKIIMIHKPKKKPSNPVNHRPISLLPTMGKILEKLLLTRLRRHFLEHNTLRDEQYGFRQLRSAPQQTLKLIQTASSAFLQTGIAPTLFLDLSMAFDKVCHPILRTKIAHHTPGYLHGILSSFLTNRYFQVSHEGALSTWRPALAGVPQGAVLSPTLFSLFINDIPEYPLTKLFIYADDIAIMARGVREDVSSKRLQMAATQTFSWLKEQRLQINEEKCQAILFSRRHSDRKISHKPIDITLNGHTLPWLHKVRYLGVTLDKGLRWHEHINIAASSMNQCTQRLSPIFRNKSLSIKTKIRLYKACIVPKGLYSCSSWRFNATAASLERLTAAENRFLRMIYRVQPGTLMANYNDLAEIPQIIIHSFEIAKRECKRSLLDDASLPDFQKFRYQHLRTHARDTILPLDIVNKDFNWHTHYYKHLRNSP